jgi:release factor family 3
MIEAEMLSQLLAPVDCGISIYFPIDPHQRDERAPMARLRGVVDAAAEQLEQIDMKPDQRANMLDTLRGFAENADFTRHRDPGLAIFVAPATAEREGLWVIPLPNSPADMLVVGRDFHIKPLLPLVAANQRFNILALSKANVRLLTATPFMWQELPLDVLPLEAQAELDSRPAAEVAPGGRVMEEVRKEILVANPRNIATAVKAAIKDDPAPIILVADPGVAGSFQQQVEIKQIYEQPLHMNAFALSDQELHAKVLDVIRPVLDVDLEAVLEQIAARLGTAEPNVAIRLEEILAAGREGRIDTVVVAEDEPLWGGFNPDGTLIAHGTPRPWDEDLLNLAAILALRNGGRAYAIPRERIPRQVPAAATLRF